MSRATESGTSIALISKTGAALQALTLNGTQIIDSQVANVPDQIFFGSVLAPWPNRLDGGSYHLAGIDYQAGQLDQAGNANHGLVYDREFEVVSQEEQQLALGYQFGSDQGYPFEVLLTVDYQLLDNGLRTRATAINNGADPAPFAIGFHPYFLAPEPFVLSGDFKSQILTDARMLPTDIVSVQGLSYAGGEMDDCYMGTNVARLQSAHFDVSIELEQDLDHFMFYRPGPDQGGSMLAIEPMSAKANALQTEIADHLLEPGQSRSFSYLIRTS